MTKPHLITKRKQIINFGFKIKDIKTDPNKRWIIPWNDYFSRIKYFFRWLHKPKMLMDFQIILVTH
jgi:hypothetical protein